MENAAEIFQVAIKDPSPENMERARQAANDPMSKLEAFFTAVREWADAFIAKINDAFEALIPAVEAWKQRMWAKYEEAGKPNGDDDAGMWRWVDDQLTGQALARKLQQQRDFYFVRVGFARPQGSGEAAY